jgi:hypothetical protein
MADTGARGLAVGVLGGLAAGGIALYAATRAWAAVDVVTGGMPRVPVEATGTSAVPWVGALALVVVTGSLALLPTGGLLRRAVSVVVCLASAGVVVGALVASGGLEEALRSEIAATPASAGLDAAAMVDAADRSVWRWVTLLGGVTGTLLGAWAVLRSPGWPVMGSRYEAPAISGSAPGEPAGAASGAGGGAGASRDSDSDGDLPETDLWRSFDRGDDPT